MADGVIEKNFPANCLVPKNETGAFAYLTKYPEYNGDGITIAIFDSGVDPRSAGLQTTPDGRPKVIERFDCSGCGDVDTTKKVTATDGIVIGLSGRQLRLTDAMKNENLAVDEYRVGLKNLYELYPDNVKDRIISEKKRRSWDESHKQAVANVERQIEKLSAAKNGQTAAQSLKEKLKAENLENLMDYLNAMEKKYADIKTTFDCILYETKDHWIAVIDVTETGNLEDALFVSEYSKTQDLQSIDEHLTISMNVHDRGDLLEFVGLCSSHGTHVASIACGSHADTALNGVAPGAQVVALGIGDGRLETMETGAACVRAMIKVMELCESGRRVHVINMSYGEHAHWSSSGRLGELSTEVVNKYGVVWVASAGNHGPALCTISTPPDLSQGTFIGVGAYVSPEMMEAEYAFRQKVPANCFTWSSRDPCIDGGQGVTVCAPGAAIASVAQFSMTKQQLYNGTSMAAPHVAGAVALLLSGLIKNNIVYSPFSIKRAIWNTATRLDAVDPFAQGNGLLNVERAYENLIQFSNQTETMIRFAVNAGLSSKGIHIRNGNPLPTEYPVTVEPVFMNDKEISPQDKIRFNLRVTMVSSAPWVQVASFLDLCYTPRAFSVKVDPTNLPPGVHSARVRAYDSSAIDKGTLFEVPVTVVQPNKLDISQSNVFSFEPASFKAGAITRTFILIPAKATWAVLKLQSPNTPANIPARFMVHTMQILPQRYCKELETTKVLTVASENFTTHAFKCQENNVLEICIAKLWSNVGDAQLTATVEFRGISSGKAHTMFSANGIYRIDLTTLTTEEISPSIQLKSSVMVLKPSETKLLPLSSRDVLPPGRQIYENVLTYNLHLSKPQELALHAPLFSNILYESEFESQLWLLFDTNKMLLNVGDAFSNNKFFKLDKGEYVIRLQVRHEKRELLEKISESVMLATIKLATPITLDTYFAHNLAILQGKKCSNFTISRTGDRPVYVAPLANDKITKAGVPNQCSWLNGTLSCAKDEIGRKVEMVDFKYVLTEGPLVKKSNGSAKETKSKLEEFNDGLRDFKNSMIAKLDLEKSEEVYKELINTHPDFLAAHISFIQKLEPNTEVKTQLPLTYASSLDKVTDLDAAKATLEQVIVLADNVITETDATALLTYYGLKADSRTEAAKIKTNMDKQRSTLLEAYVRKAIALSKIRLIEAFQNKVDDETDTSLDDGTGTTNTSASSTSTAAESLDELDIIYTEVGKFIDYADSKVIFLTLWHSFRNKQYGRMMKCLQKLYDEKLQRDVLEEQRLVADENKMGHISMLLQRAMVTANPTAYRLF